MQGIFKKKSKRDQSEQNQQISENRSALSQVAELKKQFLEMKQINEELLKQLHSQKKKQEFFQKNVLRELEQLQKDNKIMRAKVELLENETAKDEIKTIKDNVFQIGQKCEIQENKLLHLMDKFEESSVKEEDKHEEYERKKRIFDSQVRRKSEIFKQNKEMSSIDIHPESPWIRKFAIDISSEKTFVQFLGTKRKYTQILSRNIIPHHKVIKICAICSSSDIGIGIIDKKCYPHRNSCIEQVKPNVFFYFGKNGRVWEGNHKTNSIWEGFKPNEQVDMIVHIQNQRIYWLVNGVMKCEHTWSAKKQSKYIEWVPFLIFHSYKDKVNWWRQEQHQ